MIKRTVAPLLALLLATGGAVADTAALSPPEGARVLLRTSAKGVQIYTCQASGASFAWVFKAPEATLFAGGQKVGDHFAGPSWKALDGSIVTGEVAGKADAPAPNSIPWLLLRAKSHEDKGQFAQVAFIQRVDTKGGVAPTSGCDADHNGAEARIGYSARYIFYAAGP